MISLVFYHTFLFLTTISRQVFTLFQGLPMPLIVIGDENINFPNTSASPIWSEAVIQFAEAVAAALSGIFGTGDIARQAFNLDASHNPASNVTLTGLSFSSSIVRAGFVRYSVFRTTTGGGAITVAEAGQITVVYNPDGTPGSKWEIQRDYVGDASITFSIDDAGQFSFSTATITGSSQTGKISFVGSALLQ